MKVSRNGLTLSRYRVVELIGHDFDAVVEDIDTGRPLANCYRVDVAENIARAMELAWTRGPRRRDDKAYADDYARDRPLEHVIPREAASPSDIATQAATHEREDRESVDHFTRIIKAPLHDDGYRISIPTFGDAVLFEYKHSEVKHAAKIVAKMVALYNDSVNSKSVPLTKCATCFVYTNNPDAWTDGKCEACQLATMRAAATPGSAVTEGLVAMLRSRDEHGRAKYGTTLDRKDLTVDAWLQHLLEELLDGAGYVQAARREMRLAGDPVALREALTHVLRGHVGDQKPGGNRSGLDCHLCMEAAKMIAPKLPPLEGVDGGIA